MKTHEVFLRGIERGPYVDYVTVAIDHTVDDHSVVDEIDVAKAISIAYTEEKK